MRAGAARRLVQLTLRLQQIAPWGQRLWVWLWTWAWMQIPDGQERRRDG